MNAPIWTCDDGSFGLSIYIGAGDDGLAFHRHDPFACKPGMWCVAVTGWGLRAAAVVDDFGNLVEVRT